MGSSLHIGNVLAHLSSRDMFLIHFIHLGWIPLRRLGHIKVDNKSSHQSSAEKQPCCFIVPVSTIGVHWFNQLAIFSPYSSSHANLHMRGTVVLKVRPKTTDDAAATPAVRARSFCDATSPTKAHPMLPTSGIRLTNGKIGTFGHDLRALLKKAQTQATKMRRF